MTVQGWVITGRVRRRDGGAIAGARVYFVAGPGPLPDVAALTDSSGKFSLAAPYEGAYTIGCASDDFASSTASVTVTGRSETSIEVVLDRLHEA